MKQTISETKPTFGAVSFLLPVPTSTQPAPKQDRNSGGQFYLPGKDTKSMNDSQGLSRTDSDDSEYIKEDRIYSDREVAEILFKDELKSTSYKSIQKWARDGEIIGRRLGRGWRFYGRSVKDFLLRK